MADDPRFPFRDLTLDKKEMGFISWDATPPYREPTALHVLSFRTAVVRAVSFLFCHDRWLSEALDKPHELELSVGRQFISLFKLLPGGEYTGNFFPNTETNSRGERRAGLLISYWKIPVWEREGNDFADYGVIRDQHGRYVVLQLLNATFLC